MWIYNATFKLQAFLYFIVNLITYWWLYWLIMYSHWQFFWWDQRDYIQHEFDLWRQCHVIKTKPMKTVWLAIVVYCGQWNLRVLQRCGNGGMNLRSARILRLFAGIEMVWQGFLAHTLKIHEKCARGARLSELHISVYTVFPSAFHQTDVILENVGFRGVVLSLR